MRQIEQHIDATYFCWIGGYGDDDPFYYRIQSPVAMIEFDHHSGVFLTNTEPAKCHIHTVIRTPNGNDYGKDLLRLALRPGARRPRPRPRIRHLLPLVIARCEAPQQSPA